MLLLLLLLGFEFGLSLLAATVDVGEGAEGGGVSVCGHWLGAANGADAGVRALGAAHHVVVRFVGDLEVVGGLWKGVPV